MNKNFKNKYPFRLGCTSYVYPDNILPNVQKMAPIVDDIELILFESDDISNLPDKKVVTELKNIAKDYNITYTVHFPIDKDAGSQNQNERIKVYQQINKIVDLTQVLNPYAYLLHLQGISNDSTKQEINIWNGFCYEICEKITLIDDITPEKICIENLKYPLEWHMNIINQFGFSLCLDTGHLWLNCTNWEEIFAQNIHNTRVLHLHGVNEGVDHISLNKNEIEDLVKVLKIIKNGYKHIVTLEVFSINDIFHLLWEESYERFK